MAVVQSRAQGAAPNEINSRGLQSFLDGLANPALILRDIEVIACNPAASNFLGAGAGRTLADLFAWPDPALARDLSRVGASGGYAVGQATLKSDVGAETYGAVRYAAQMLLPSNSQQPPLIVLHFYDQYAPLREDIRRDIELAELSSEIHRLKRSHEVQRHRRTVFQGFFGSAATGMAVVGLDGAFLEVNDRLRAICGYSREELLRLTFQEITHPDDLEEDESLVARLAHREIKEYTLAKRYVRKDGEIVWVEITVSATFDVDGRPEVYTVVIRDISQERKLEATRNLLLGEMNHRVKNTLAIVQGIVQQTLQHSSSPEQFSRALEDRLFCIARAYDLLNQSEWEPLSFKQIIDAKRAGPFSAYAARIRHEGEDEKFTPQGTIIVNLVLHELATNAIKHGALSCDGGEVSIVTRREERPLGFEYVVEWKEQGGPAVQKPRSKGFGEFMLMKGVQFGLGGVTEARFEPTGLEYTLSFSPES